MKTAAVLATVAMLALLGAPPASAKSSSSNDDALMRGDYWSVWMRATHRQCPANHLEWVGMSDEALDLVGGFNATLTRAQQKQVAVLVDDRCRAEWGGFTCELAATADAYHQLGLLKRFARFGCESYDCYGNDSICRPAHRRR